jgi:hypothetical protein
VRGAASAFEACRNRAARTFDVLRNGQTWRGVRPVELDSWSVLLDVPDQGRVLLPKPAVDAYRLRLDASPAVPQMAASSARRLVERQTTTSASN